MLIFISGGVRSGKSDLGEKYTQLLSKKALGRRIYLATAKVFDEEMARRVRRHKKIREGKGYITIEQSENISKIKNRLQKSDTVLLDCLGTLTANEMFGEDGAEYGGAAKEELSQRIFSEIMAVNAACGNLIVISNEVFSSGDDYEEPTKAYIEVLGSLHIKIAAAADTVVECAFGHSIFHKGAAL